MTTPCFIVSLEQAANTGIFECGACGFSFSNGGYRRHEIIAQELPYRCPTETEMESCGMRRNAKGVWLRCRYTINHIAIIAKITNK